MYHAVHDPERREKALSELRKYFSGDENLVQAYVDSLSPINGASVSFLDMMDETEYGKGILLDTLTHDIHARISGEMAEKAQKIWDHWLIHKREICDPRHPKCIKRLNAELEGLCREMQ